MSSMMDATPSKIPLTCASCYLSHPTACCYCDVDLCEACTPLHLSVCTYAQQRRFRSWKPEKKAAYF